MLCIIYTSIFKNGKKIGVFSGGGKLYIQWSMNHFASVFICDGNSGLGPMKRRRMD